MKKISVVVPVYFNQSSLAQLFEKLSAVARTIADYDFEFVFVDDGSGDDSYASLRTIAQTDKRVKVVKLSRNFGSFNACLAGLIYVTGDCAILLSADLQDPPELVPQMVDRWRQGYETVMATRRNREDGPFVKFTSAIYYSLLRKFALPTMPKGGFDFVLIDKKVIEVIKRIDERNTSLMGLILWTGFNQTTISYDRKARPFGKSRWTIQRKIKYFLDSFVSFSHAPVHFMQLLGISLAILGALYSIFIAYQKIRYGFPVPGISALIVIVLILNGAIMVMLGVLGEYLWRNVDETKRRPNYVVSEVIQNSAVIQNGDEITPARRIQE